MMTRTTNYRRSISFTASNVRGALSKINDIERIPSDMTIGRFHIPTIREDGAT
jgi:hypothetical protein